MSPRRADPPGLAAGRPTAGSSLAPPGRRGPGAPAGRLLDSTRSRRRRSIVVQVGEPRTGDQAARALASSLSGFGIEATYVGRHEDAEPIAAAAVAAQADSVEVCLARGTGVPILRDLLRELIRLGRREVSIVVHPVD